MRTVNVYLHSNKNLLNIIFINLTSDYKYLQNCTIYMYIYVYTMLLYR